MGIRIYSSRSDKKLRQMISWCSIYDLEYDILNFNQKDFTYDEYLKALALSDNGAYDLIAKRSKDYAKLKNKVDFDSFTLKEFYYFLLEHPEIVNQPIMMDDRKLAIGFKLDDISVFIPKSQRKLGNIDWS